MDKQETDVAKIISERFARLVEEAIMWSKVAPHIQPVIDELYEDMKNFSLSTTVDMSFSGNKELLAKIIKCVRRNGFEIGNHRPRAGDSMWNTFIHKEGCPVQIFLMFSSTVCRRVQVGTKMEEVPVYETICGDESPLELPDELPHPSHEQMVAEIAASSPEELF